MKFKLKSEVINVSLNKYQLQLSAFIYAYVYF